MTLIVTIIIMMMIIIIIISTFLSNYAVNMFASGDVSTSSAESFESFKKRIDNSSSMISSSSTLGSSGNTSAITRLYNTTGMISFVGEVNVNNLQRPLFKPFIGINSDESYLTRDFASYKAAKSQSEIIKPNTKVFEVKAPSSSAPTNYSNTSLHNDEEQWPLLHRTNPNRTSSVVLAKFEGLTQSCCIPPDVQVAAGTNYVVEMVNLDGAIYTKNGTLVKSFGLEYLFNPIVKESQEVHVSITDAVLLFDNTSQRWFASISDITSHSIRVAVSKTDDPTGIWRIYNFPFEFQSNNCSDQPFIGLSDDKFIVTVNNWGNDCNWYSDNQSPEFRGVHFTIADKTDLLNGSGSVRSIQSQPDLNYFSLHPVITLSPTTTLLIATAGDFSHDKLQLLYIDGPSLYNLHIRTISYVIQDTHVAPDGIQSIEQSTTTTTAKEPKVSTGDARIQSAIWYQGKLWLAFNDGCFINGDTKSRSCIRLIQIDTITNRVIQDFDIGALASSLYYPAISINRGGGNLGIIFGYSSHSIYPSILVSTRASNDDDDELNSIKEPEFLKLGTANELSNRYGDYFAASSDPSNTSIIWVAGEYHHLIATWSTYIGQLYTQK